MSPTVGRQPSHILERVPRVVNPFGLRPFAPGMCGHAGMALTAVSLFPIRLIVLIVAVLIAGALAVLADVSKIDVYALARWINDHHAERGFSAPPIPARCIRD